MTSSNQDNIVINFETINDFPAVMMPKNLRIIVFLCVFLLPILCNLVEHSASTILAVLVLIDIYAWATRKKTSGFSPAEKAVMWSFAFYFFVSVFFFLANGLFRESSSFHWNLDHELRFLGFVPVYFLFTRTGLKAWTVWYGSAVAAIACGIFSIHYQMAMNAAAVSQSAKHAMAFVEALRVSGAYTPITFGQLSLAFGFMSIAGIRYFHKKHPGLVLIPLLALLGGILSSFLSGTRGAILAIPLLALIFFIQLGSFRFAWRKRIALVLSVSLLSAGLFFMPGSTMDRRVENGLNQAEAFFNGNVTGHYVVRLAMWREALKMFMAHPFFGIGKNGYQKIIQAKVARGEVPKTIEKFYSPHNNYLSNMVAYGISGLLMILAIFLSPFFIFIPARKAPWPQNDMAFTGIMLAGSFMVFALTETIFYRNINISIYLIMLAAILHLTTSNERILS